MAPTTVACPVCAARIEGAGAAACPRCETPHHQECWDYVGGCAIFGCRPALPPGTSSPAVRGAATPGRPRVAGLARWYLRVVRLQWWALLVMGFGLAFLPVLGTLIAFGSPRTPGGELLFWLAAAYLFAGAIATVAYLGLVPPLLLLRGSLAYRLGGPVQLPTKGARALLDSIEVSGPEGLLLRSVSRSPWIYTAFTAASFLVNPMVGIGFLSWMIFGIPALLGLRSFTQDRVVAVRALQNRLAASLKGG